MHNAKLREAIEGALTGWYRYDHNPWGIERDAARIADSYEVQEAYEAFYNLVYDELEELDSNRVDPYGGKYM